MKEILDALANATIWQIAIAAIVVVAGSSAAAALIKGGFDSRTASKQWRRSVRDSALGVLGEAYALYLKSGDPNSAPDKRAGEKIAEMGARLRVAMAKIGDTGLLDRTAEFTMLGELYGARDADTSVDSLDELFRTIIFNVTKGIPKK